MNGIDEFGMTNEDWDEMEREYDDLQEDIVSDDRLIELAEQAIPFIKSVPDGLTEQEYRELEKNEKFQTFRKAYLAKVPDDRQFTAGKKGNFFQVFRENEGKNMKELSDEELRGCFQYTAKIGGFNIPNLKECVLPYFEEWIKMRKGER